MPSLTAKDRVSLCLFSFEDGRRCRTPRTARHRHFCFYHAQKESQSHAAEKLSEDLAYFFSGDYLSACDLNTALAHLIPAVIRGEIKPRLARTVAYMFQTLLQSIHISEEEYINAFSTDGWRRAVRTSVNGNHDYLFPPDPDAAKPPESEPDQPAQAPSQSPAQAQPSARPAPATPIEAGLARPDSPAQPAHPTHAPSFSQQPASPTPQPPPTARPSPADTEAALNVARSLFPSRPNATPAQPIAAPTASPTSTICHPERSEGSRPNPTQPPADETHHPAIATPSSNPTPNPITPTQTTDATPPPQSPTPRRQPGAPTRDPYAVHFDHTHRLLIDGKPW
jgi:hypothetical protein